MRNDSVIGFIADTTVHLDFMISTFSLISDDSGKKQRFGGAWQYSIGSYVHLNRNKMATDFLEQFQDRTWLMSIDTDMVFSIDDVYALFEEADLKGPGIYVAPYAMPTGWVFGMIDENLRYVEPTSVPTDPTPVDMAGTGFMLIHRQVLESTGPKSFNPLFTLDDGEMLAEDISFCIRAKRAGFTPLLIPKSNPGHIKSVVLQGAR